MNQSSGVKVSIARTNLSITSDSKGKFQLDNIPAGRIDLFIDGRTTNPSLNPAQAQYPSLHFEAYAIQGRANQLAHPIYLPALSTSPESVKTVGGNEDVILKLPGLAGFQIKVKANSVTFPDGSRQGTLIISPVTADRLPMSPPAGEAQFGIPAWTIQPAGTRFDPPIEVTLPNTRAYPAGDNIPIVQWDHDLAQYVPMGRATVSEDGSVLITDSGSGLTKAGWGGACVYDPDKCGKKDPKCTDCEKIDTSGDCPTCVADPSKENSKIKFGVFSGSGGFSQGLFFLTLRAEARGSLDADLICCKGAGGARKPSGVFQLAASLEGAIEGPIPVPGLGLGIKTYIPFGGAVKIGVVGKVAGVGELAGEGEFNRCESKICARLTGTAKLLAEVGPKIEYDNTWEREPTSSELSAVVGMEGGQQWNLLSCDGGEKKRFFTVSIKAEYSLPNRTKFTIFNLSKTIEDTVPASGGEFRPFIDNLFQAAGL